MPSVFKKAELCGRLLFERRNVDAEQTNLRPPLPVLAEQDSNLLEDLGVELRGLYQRVGPRDRCEILVAQLELNRSGVEGMFAQAARDHFRQAHQGGLELRRVGGVVVEGVFMADGLGIFMLADVGVEPSARIFAARFASERQSP